MDEAMDEGMDTPKNGPHETFKEAMEALEGSLNTLHAKIVRVAERHYALVEAQEKSVTEWKDKGVLRLGTHRKGNHVQVKWYTIKWFGKGAARREVKASIRKSAKEDTFSMAHLKENAKEWEWPIVEKTELEMALLRKQASFVVKAMTSLRYASMAARKYDDLYSEPGDE